MVEEGWGIKLPYPLILLLQLCPGTEERPPAGLQAERAGDGCKVLCCLQE